METMVREASARPWAQPLCKRWTARLSLSFNKASDVLTRLCPVEMGCITGQNDDATWRIRLHFITVELVTQADIYKRRT